MESTSTSIFDKKMSDLTVTEDMKLAVATAVITTVISVAVPMSVLGIQELVRKFKTRKANKLALVTAEEN